MGSSQHGGGVEARIRRVENGLRPAAEPFGATRATLVERMAHYLVPGVSVAVIDQGEIAWARGYGVLSAESGRPVTPETLFQAASISKPVTALAALRLVEQGRLALDDDVNALLRSWRVPATPSTAGFDRGWQPRISLRQLLSHTAGLTIHGFPGYSAGEALPTLVQILDGVPPANTGPVRVDTIPGLQFRYAGGGTTVVQQLLTDFCDQPFPQIMQDLILAPLGTTRSTYEQPLSASLYKVAASAHGSTGEEIVGRWHTYPEMAAAGLWTTPSDLARVALAVQRAWSGRASPTVTSEMARQMLSVQAALSPDSRANFDAIGLGFFLGDSGDSLVFGHTGGNEGFLSLLIASASRGTGAAIMVNGNGGSPLIGELHRAIAEEYEWTTLPPVTENVSQRAYAGYAGEYELASQLRVSLRYDDSRLYLQTVGQPAIALRPMTPDVFLADGLQVEVRFEQRDAPARSELVLRQNAQDLRGRRCD